MPSSPRVGAVDLGSNSFHLVIAQEAQGRVQVIDRIKERVGLGAAMKADGTLDTQIAARALRCLRLFRERLSSVPVGRVRAVGTKAFRDLRKHPKFHQRAEQALGNPIEVVSGEEEARLIYLGVREFQGGAGGRLLAVDIGGGSTEMVAGSGSEPALTESLSMGSSSYSRRFFIDGALKKRSFTRAVLRARNQIRPIAGSLRGHGWDRPFGTSGTFLALARILETNNWAPSGVTPEGLVALRDHLLRFPNMAEVDCPGLKEHRREVLPGGLSIALAVMEELGLERLPVSDAALREGLMVDLLGRLSDRDVRSESVRHLAQRFHVDRAQADRVTAMADTVFDAVRKAWDLSSKLDRAMLHWAAQLHEVGLAISHTGFHRHGAYLIEHSDPHGFSRDETRFLGELVRQQRKRISVAAVSALPAAMQRRFQCLLMPLRVAVRVHRSRSDETLPPLSFEADETTLRIHGPSGWRKDFPLTEDDLLAETRAWRELPLSLELADS